MLLSIKEYCGLIFFLSQHLNVHFGSSREPKILSIGVFVLNKNVLIGLLGMTKER